MRIRLLALSSVALLLALLAACGGGSDKTGLSFEPGSLTDPRSVPTAAPWSDPPEVIFQDAAPTTSSGGAPQPGATGSPLGSGQCGSKYKVQANDNPWAIANRCGVTLDSILAANPGINPNNLQVGQEINIPRP